MNSTNVSLGLLILIAVASLGMVVYAFVDGTQVPTIAMSLLGIVLGYLGSHLSSAQGASQALTVPPASPASDSQIPNTQI